MNEVRWVFDNLTDLARYLHLFGYHDSVVHIDSAMDALLEDVTEIRSFGAVVDLELRRAARDVLRAKEARPTPEALRGIPLARCLAHPKPSHGANNSRTDGVQGQP